MSHTYDTRPPTMRAAQDLYSELEIAFQNAWRRSKTILPGGNQLLDRERQAALFSARESTGGQAAVILRRTIERFKSYAAAGEIELRHAMERRTIDVDKPCPPRDPATPPPPPAPPKPDPETLLSFAKRGIVLSTNALGQLVVCPTSALTREDRQLLAERKHRVVLALQDCSIIG